MGPQHSQDLGVLRVLHTFLSSWRFPVFALSLLGFVVILVAALLLVPASPSALSAFAEDFRTWCFGYDPATGEIEIAYVAMLVLDPLLLAAVLVVVWYGPLRERVHAGLRATVPYVGAAAVAALGLAVSLGALANDARTPAQLPFPAERLRTRHAPPAFELTDHRGDAVSLEALRGKVVVLTGVYSTCGYTCPMILDQARRAVAGLAPEMLEDVAVVGITLDPEHDTPARLAEMARLQGVDAPLFRLVTGESRVVDETLDDLGFMRERNPETGVIDHANLFVVIDRSGTIAYRFSLGAQQERWLGTALELLAREEVT